MRAAGIGHPRTAAVWQIGHSDREQIMGAALFTGVSRPVVERLCAKGLIQTLAKDQVLFSEGESAAFVHVLLSGRVALTGRGSDGREVVVEFVGPGDVVVAPAVVLEMPYLVSGRTVEEARALVLPADAFRRALAQDHRLCLQMLQQLARYWRSLVRQIRDLKLRSSPQRLGSYLLSQAGANPGGAAMVRLPGELRLLAGRLGMTPESLSRAFRLLKTLGVSRRGRQVAIGDVRALEEFCKPDAVSE